jgi:hypothetical protein
METAKRQCANGGEGKQNIEGFVKNPSATSCFTFVAAAYHPSTPHSGRICAPGPAKRGRVFYLTIHFDDFLRDHQNYYFKNRFSFPKNRRMACFRCPRNFFYPHSHFLCLLAFHFPFQYNPYKLSRNQPQSPPNPFAGRPGGEFLGFFWVSPKGCFRHARAGGHPVF